MIVTKGFSVADFLEEKRKEISQRLKELRPLVDEYHRLEAAERALSGVDGRPATAAAAPAKRARTARGKSSNAVSYTHLTLPTTPYV